jgi:hypothetical protein
LGGSGVVIPGFRTDVNSSQDGANGFTTIAESMGGTGTCLIVKFLFVAGCTRKSGTEHEPWRAVTCGGNAFGVLAVTTPTV